MIRNYEMSSRDKVEHQRYLETCRSIREATAPLVPNETGAEKQARKKRLAQNFEQFCQYYLAKFMDAPFGWFHKKAAREIVADPTGFFVLEWAREHAKSVFADVMMPMFLYARGELSGLLIASATGEKATGLLADLQAQFDANDLWINDYGNLAAFGDWSQGNFSTTDGIGFWAFGRGQSPRGAREGANRPNYAVVDDLDDKVLVKNIARVREARDWVLEDLYGALATKGGRLVVCGNRIHKHSVLAHLVGDTEPDQPKRAGVRHIKVFALENPKTHAKDLDGTPAWKERYKKEDILRKRDVMGDLSWRREQFHEHHEEGNIFRHEWIEWSACPGLSAYEGIEVYIDPSFKATKDNDYKAIVVTGKAGGRYYILKAWVRQATVSAMVKRTYGLFGEFEQFARYRMEANFIQDLLLKDFDEEAIVRGYHIPLSPDKRAKPDKVTRIENLSPLFERGLIVFNEAEKQNPDMQKLVGQLLGFPTGHDDGPDALEGGVYYLNRADNRSRFQPRMGRFSRNKAREM